MPPKRTAAQAMVNIESWSAKEVGFNEVLIRSIQILENKIKYTDQHQECSQYHKIRLGKFEVCVYPLSKPYSDKNSPSHLRRHARILQRFVRFLWRFSQYSRISELRLSYDHFLHAC